jgi:UDP-glucose 6-dehydrogenase
LIRSSWRHKVVNVNFGIDEGIVAVINNGESPIYETGLDDPIVTHGGDAVTTTTD